MLIQFKVVSDSSLWILDTDKLRYVRVSRPISEIAENPSTDSAVEEFGALVEAGHVVNKFIVIGVDAYRLEGRTPTTEGPGGGLTSVAILVRIVNTEVLIGVNANVLISEPACIKQIDAVRCEVLGQGTQEGK